jgi:polyisoprenoid-binding protein YceI
MALEVYKTGFMSGKKHLFEFERYSGTLRYDAAAPESARVELSIESGSIVLKDDWLKASDMKKVREHAEQEMLDVARHPAIRFVSGRVEPTGPGAFRVTGELTIRGVSKPAVIAASINEAGDGKLRITGKSEVRLKDYELKPPSAVLGMVGTKNEMAFEFVVAASR